ncbi:MAG: hypothetical protein ABSH22_17055 [Tepidisphaeraceae bacterium]|jgi:hypothetical protein
MLNDPVKVPNSVKWLVAFGLITAIFPLFSDLPWQATAGAKGAYKTWLSVFSWIELPLNLMLLAACVGVCLRGRSWGRTWMLRWALLVTIYETVQLLVMAQWVIPKADLTDIPSGDEMAQALDPSSIRGLYEMLYAVYWISMISLSSYAWWVLTRTAVREFYESSDGTTPPRLSEDAPFVPPT